MRYRSTIYWVWSEGFLCACQYQEKKTHLNCSVNYICLIQVTKEDTESGSFVVGLWSGCIHLWAVTVYCSGLGVWVHHGILGSLVARASHKSPRTKEPNCSFWSVLLCIVFLVVEYVYIIYHSYWYQCFTNLSTEIFHLGVLVLPTLKYRCLKYQMLLEFLCQLSYII